MLVLPSDRGGARAVATRWRSSSHTEVESESVTRPMLELGETAVAQSSPVPLHQKGHHSRGPAPPTNLAEPPPNVVVARRQRRREGEEKFCCQRLERSDACCSRQDPAPRRLGVGRSRREAQLASSGRRSSPVSCLLSIRRGRGRSSNTRLSAHTSRGDGSMERLGGRRTNVGK